MPIKAIGLHIKALGLAASALALTAQVVSCEQPEITCRVAPGGFAAKYTLKSGSGACAELKGDTVGMHGYNPPGADPLEGPDLSTKQVALRTQRLGDLYYLAVQAEEILGAPFLDSDAALSSIGTFASTLPDGDGICVAPTTSPARQNLPVIPERADPDSEVMGMLPEEPAHDITYTWSNIRVEVTGRGLGTTMSADLEYTENGCTATYSVIGLFPAVDCGGVDASGNPTGLPDDAICKVEADPENGIAAGSGITPDLFDVVKCDPDLLLCVLTRAPGG
jgi:hypothetical protein